MKSGEQDSSTSFETLAAFVVNPNQMLIPTLFMLLIPLRSMWQFGFIVLRQSSRDWPAFSSRLPRSSIRWPLSIISVLKVSKFYPVERYYCRSIRYLYLMLRILATDSSICSSEMTFRSTAFSIESII